MDREPGEPFRILFVCTGNTCRSPMAEAIARRLAEEEGWHHVEVASAGVSAGEGAPASPGAVAAARTAGLDLSGHASAPLTPENVEAADLILVMTPAHLRLVEAAGGKGKVVLLGAFAAGDEQAGPGGPEGWAVPDPFGGDERAYEETFEALKGMVERSLARLRPMMAP